MVKRKYVLASILAVTLISWIYWSSNHEVNDTIKILSEQESFKHTIIQPSDKLCTGNPFLVIIVTSYVGHIELRSAHRRAMPQKLLEAMNAKRVFLLAKIPEKDKIITQEAIIDESNIFGDILQGSFVENYRNLTFKHLMGLQWASTACSNASYILKVDDDTVFNLERTYRLLETLDANDIFLLGYILNNTKPRRNKENKWYVTREEYSRKNYPAYLSGWYYITTPKTARKITEEAIYHPKFWIDDILITGLLTEALHIKLRQLPRDYWLEYYELLECCLRDMINKQINCDSVVGPNGGRENLIVEFNDAIRNCDKSKKCTKRDESTPLKKVCIVNSERTIFSNGQPQVELYKL